jgi:hypothetical protein
VIGVEVMILAVAGRRIDDSNSKDLRFPLCNVDIVRLRIQALFQSKAVTAIVSSAACGADLIALGEARELGLRYKIILPFARERFRISSVSDRPGNWGPVYDEILDEAQASGNLEVLENGGLESALGEDAYRRVNGVILAAAFAFTNELHQPASAVLVWEGASRGDSDITGDFGIEAKRLGLPVFEVLTV